VNAKVDYTLLDRWRHSHVWWARKRLDCTSASVRGADAAATGLSRQGEHDKASGRVVHLPVAD